MLSHPVNIRWRGGLVAIVAVAAFGLAVGAAPAGAVIAPATSTHARISFMRTPRQAAAFACTTNCGAMTYHGGPVMHSERLISIYWGPSGHYIGGTYKAGLNQWINDFAAADYAPSNVFSVAQQYYDNSGAGATKRFVAYDVINGGYISDTDAYPSSGCTYSGLSVCLNDGQLRTEIQNIVSTHALPTGPNVEYLLFLPYQVGQCFDSSSSQCFAYGTNSNSAYCAYHSFIGSGSTQIVYANMPFIYTSAGCDANKLWSFGYANASSIDPEVGTLSHEILESMTDVDINAWYGSGGGSDEIGDKCAYNYDGVHYGSGTTGLANNGLGEWNQSAAGDEYLMQTEFSNRNSNGSTTGCVKSDTDPQPTVSISPTTATHGVATTFHANTTDAAGVAYVSWSFGDGASATTTGTSVAHTYTTAGTKSMIVIVTDNHGNEKKVVQSITVS